MLDFMQIMIMAWEAIETYFWKIYIVVISFSGWNFKENSCIDLILQTSGVENLTIDYNKTPLSSLWIVWEESRSGGTAYFNSTKL